MDYYRDKITFPILITYCLFLENFEASLGPRFVSIFSLFLGNLNSSLRHDLSQVIKVQCEVN